MLDVKMRAEVDWLTRPQRILDCCLVDALVWRGLCRAVLYACAQEPKWIILSKQAASKATVRIRLRKRSGTPGFVTMPEFRT